MGLGIIAAYAQDAAPLTESKSAPTLTAPAEKPFRVDGSHHFFQKTQPVYEPVSAKQQTVLQMGYAQYKLQNREDWAGKTYKKHITSVDLVFTQYPVNKADWLTDYDWLLEKRIETLQEAIPELRNPTHRIRWNIILQTDCPDEATAQARFHGAVIRYQVRIPKPLKRSIAQIRAILDRKASFLDSVVFNSFERNDWKNVLVVNDWTGSMYEYGAQAVLWHRMNFKLRRVKHFVFFNDGDDTPNDGKLIGYTGGIYPVSAEQMQPIFDTMLEVMFNGYGGDDEENDLEAILYGLKHYADENFKEVILVADNKSGVRDMRLLKKINRPVRVLLCGVGFGVPIHPDYLQIARRTGGSVHTMADDLAQLGNLKEGDTFSAMGVEYRYEGGQFIATKPALDKM